MKTDDVLSFLSKYKGIMKKFDVASYAFDKEYGWNKISRTCKYSFNFDLFVVSWQDFEGVVSGLRLDLKNGSYAFVWVDSLDDLKSSIDATVFISDFI